jgi:hypothetical protein
MLIAPLFTLLDLVDELDTLRRMYGLITAYGAANNLAIAVYISHSHRIRGGDYGDLHP